MSNEFEIRLAKLEKIRELGIDPYPYTFQRSHSFEEIKKMAARKEAEELEKEATVYRICGRIVAFREMGKSAFLHIFDGQEKMQIYVRKDIVSERDYALLNLLDIGDIIGTTGTLFITRTGELTLLVKELFLLSKALRPLPEKWHGLQDKELRFRQRYLDLIVNEQSRKIFRQRFRVIQLIREFFIQRGYQEVETPMMHPIPGGAAARPFVTHHNALDIDLYLRIAPELYLKRLLVGGMEKVFEINRNFRNEGISMMHNPEFTMLEFYELYQDFEYYMNLTEELFGILAKEILQEKSVVWREKEINFQPPFRRVRFIDEIVRHSGISNEDVWNEKILAEHIKKLKGDLEDLPTFARKLEWLFDHYVQTELINPTFVTHYPKVLSPLSKNCRQDSRLTERFELFVAGIELANGFSELNDPCEQLNRFKDQLEQREQGDSEAHLIDNDFIVALEHGMAPAAGEGIGIDRLVMLLTGAESLKEVILFPQLRPQEK